MTENNLITITIKLFANLRELGPAKTIEKFQKDTTVQVILDKYQLPFKEMKLIILINGKPHITPEYILKDGDVLAIFPPLAGG
ncbi:MAG: MoaD/ThiS family protein [Candidatus Lokiarchaeota archaeon]|nr:MoaD/ThiS family protein [Candidatus Lokiarchaeota archaeon]